MVWRLHELTLHIVRLNDRQHVLVFYIRTSLSLTLSCLFFASASSFLFIFLYFSVHCFGFKGLSENVARTKLAALYSATKSLHNSCTAKLQQFSSFLEAKQQLHSSCSGLQKRCAAFEGSLKLSAAVLQRSCRLSNAAK